MKTAVDTNVLMDVFRDDPVHCLASADALRRCMKQGSLVSCDVVWAELSSLFDPPSALRERMDLLGIRFEAMDKETAEYAGALWSQYRRTGGTRERVMADFLVGAHAVRQAQRLLTRDRGFYRQYFAGLDILDPSTSAGS